MKEAVSATFTTYASILAQISNEIKGKFRNFKQSVRNDTKAYERVMTEASENDIEWEEDTVSGDESVADDFVYFRTDLKDDGNIEQNVSSTTIELALTQSSNSPVETTPFETALYETTPVDLEDNFQRELSKASILADFQERYVIAALKNRRNGLSNDAKKLWHDTMTANPLDALESVSRSLSGISRKDEVESNFKSSIREISSSSAIEGISEETHAKYSRFLPLETPELDFDYHLLKSMDENSPYKL